MTDEKSFENEMYGVFRSDEMKEAFVTLAKGFRDAKGNKELYRKLSKEFVGTVINYKEPDKRVWFDLALSLQYISLTAFILFYKFFGKYIFVSIRKIRYFTSCEHESVDTRLANFLNMCRTIDPDFVYEKNLNRKRGTCSCNKRDCNSRVPHLLVYLTMKHLWKSAACISQIPVCVNEYVINEVSQLIADCCNTYPMRSQKESRVFTKVVVDAMMQAGGPSNGIASFGEKRDYIFGEWRISEQKAIALWNLVRMKNHTLDTLPIALWSICVDYLMTQNSRKLIYMY